MQLIFSPDSNKHVYVLFQVSLYEADKPNSALDYLKNNFSGKETEILQLKVNNLTRYFDV